MKIGLDYISSFGAGGNATYTRELIKYLAKIDQRNDYYLYTYIHKLLPFYKEEITCQKNFHYQAGYICWPSNFLKKNIKSFDQQLLSKNIKRDKIDIFHLTNPLQFNRKIKNFIVTIHDLCYLMEPDFVKQSSIYFYQKNLEDILERSDAIIAVSQSTKANLLDNFKLSTDKVFVIYEGVSKIFKPNINKNYLSEKFGLTKKYILFVGQLQPRKNLIRLFKAYARLGHELRNKYQMVVVGQPRNEAILKKLNKLVDKLKIKDKVTFLGYVKTKELPYLYGSAAVFAYPSLYEGFGLPVLESLACGVPVITSNISSLPEVLGQGGLLVNPYSVEEIKSALEKILTDNNLRNDLIKQGIKQSQDFNWLNTAQQTFSLYEKIYQKKYQR